jgi:hypothetical protein
MDFKLAYAVYSCSSEIWCPLMEADTAASQDSNWPNVGACIRVTLALCLYLPSTSSASVKKCALFLWYEFQVIEDGS